VTRSLPVIWSTGSVG